jgi:hypothetical protein
VFPTQARLRPVFGIKDDKYPARFAYPGYPAEFKPLTQNTLDFMDTAPLLQWLGLPPGPWPPDDRKLLGLPDGPISESLAEQNALVRMEQLRPHQLKNPELVTEGMNRLAQALIALTTPSSILPPPIAPAARPVPAPAITAPVITPKKTQPEMPLVDFSPATASRPTSVVSETVPQVLEAEVIEVAGPKLPARVTQAAPRSTSAILYDEPAPILLAVPPMPPGLGVLSNRRKAYRELVFLRKLRTIWDQLGPVAAAPNEPLRTPESVYVIRTVGRELRELLISFPTAATIVGRDGRIVVAVLTQPHATAVVRDLIPEQRTALAADWVAGRTMIQSGYVALRAALRQSLPRHRVRSAQVAVVDFLRGNREWVLVGMTIILFIVGWIRFLSRVSSAG